MGGSAAAAVGALNAALRDEDADVRRLAAQALGELGPAAEASRPLLIETLQDERLAVRLAAAFALQKLDPDGDAQRPVLIAAMKTGDGGVILRVAGYGAEAPWAVPTLIELLADKRPGVRRLSATALGQIGSPAAAATSSLRQAAASDSDDQVRDAAQQALQAIASP